METKLIKKIILFCLFGFLFLFFLGSVVVGAGAPQVQTNSASTIQSNSAILNGNLSNLGGYDSTFVWFQWGTNTSYENSTSSIKQNYTGPFSQQIVNLIPNRTYYYRAVAQNNYTISYGQDMSFVTGQSGNQQIVVSAGLPLYLNFGQSGTLQGSAYDYSGNYLSYYWTCSGGTLSNNTIAQPTYTAPTGNQNNSQSTYICILTVTNTLGQSNSSSTTIYVNYNNYGSFNIQTNSVTNNYSGQATLNGYVRADNPSNLSVWFQWGKTADYGNETNHQSLSQPGAFSQNMVNLTINQTYHYRAAAKNNQGDIIYGQDAAFTSNGLRNYYLASNNASGNNLLSIIKTVRNLSSGNLTWANSINASPSDVLQFSITLQASANQPIHNVTARDLFPANLIYNNNLTIDGISSNGDITGGINIGDLSVGQIKTITYQAKLAPAANFSLKQTILNNSVYISSSEVSNITATSVIYVTKSSGEATNVSTGLTNNFLTDSFFLPLVIILAGIWLWRAGIIYGFTEWVKVKIKI